MQVYPVDEFYNHIVEKRLNGEELNDYEKNKINDFEIDIEKKAINDAGIIKNLMAERGAIVEAIASLESKMFSIDKKIETIKFDLKNMLELKDIKKIKTPYYDITVCMNNPSTNIYNETLIPMEYIKQTVVQRIDKVNLLKDLKLGVSIPGVEIQQKTRLDIK